MSQSSKSKPQEVPQEVPVTPAAPHSSEMQATSSTKDSIQLSSEKKPTTPPRVSFGVEIEFLVAYVQPSLCRDEDEEHRLDVDNDLGLPPLHQGDCGSVFKRIITCFLDHGIPVKSTREPPADYDQRREEIGANSANSWVVGSDSTVLELSDRACSWMGIEIASPASYAYDEAFDMIRLVLNMITTNFRTRVNTTCGLHVHVGNGPQRIDMRAARNYAALMWSADPLLSTLHCPGRGVSFWSQSIRRTNVSTLARGKGAADAFEDAMLKPSGASRYQGRARKLGETPVPSRVKYLNRLEQTATDSEGVYRELDWESDDSDLKADSKPFYRPRKTKSTKVQTTFMDLLAEQRSCGIPPLEDLAKLDATRVTGGPPQVHFPLPEGISGVAPSKAGKAKKTTKPDATSLERPYMPILERKSRRVKQKSTADILRDDQIMRRLDAGYCLPPMFRWGEDQRFTDQYIHDTAVARKDTWSGVKEVLSCDVGTHQVAFLMNDNQSLKNVNSNWAGHCAERLRYLQSTGRELMCSTRPYMTVENREAMGSLDGAWVATWARINCRLLEWARDAEPAVFLRVLGLLADEDGAREARYDVVDLLDDIGCYREARHCEERLRRAEEAYYECMLIDSNAETAENEVLFSNEDYDWSEASDLEGRMLAERGTDAPNGEEAPAAGGEDAEGEVRKFSSDTDYALGY